MFFFQNNLTNAYAVRQLHAIPMGGKIASKSKWYTG